MFQSGEAMKIRGPQSYSLILAACLACAGPAAAYEYARLPGVLHVPLAAASSLYELADPTPVSSTRWEGLFGSRLELSTGLLPRHEVRLSAARARGEGPDLFSSAFPPQAYDSTWIGDPLRATYRYTFLERRDWAWKVGITARLGDWDALHAGSSGFDRTRFGALPLVHLAGEGRLARDWLLSVDADGLLTTRGRTVDIGVRVNYLLSRSFSLFGGYRLSDHAAEGDETSTGPSNTANVGVRYRF